MMKLNNSMIFGLCSLMFIPTAFCSEMQNDIVIGEKEGQNQISVTEAPQNLEVFKTKLEYLKNKTDHSRNWQNYLWSVENLFKTLLKQASEENKLHDIEEIVGNMSLSNDEDDSNVAGTFLDCIEQCAKEMGIENDSKEPTILDIVNVGRDVLQKSSDVAFLVYARPINKKTKTIDDYLQEIGLL